MEPFPFCAGNLVQGCSELGQNPGPVGDNPVAIMPPVLRPGKWRSIVPGLSAAALLGLTFLAYARFLSAGFAATDSLPLVETSRLSSPADAARLFTQPVMAGTRFVLGEVVYRPFVSLTFGLDYAVWGQRALGYHLTNLGLHLAAVLGILLLLRQLGLRYWSSLAGAAVFALHPIVVASVPVIGRRDSVLPVTAFVAGAWLLLAADRSRGTRRVLLCLGSLVLMAIALVSKESTFAAMLTLPMLLIAAHAGRSNSPRDRSSDEATPAWFERARIVLARARILVPYLLLMLAPFLVRSTVLRGIGGGPDADLLHVDLDKYSQILGAFTRDLAWPIAWIASSTREIWPRLAAVCLLGLVVTIVWLPRRQAVLAGAGTLWIVGFALFSMLLKIATIAWLLYFVLVGVSLVFAAGVEGSLLRLRQPSHPAGWRGRVARAMSGVLLVGLAAYAATALWVSPLLHDYYQWQVAGDVTQRFTRALTACLAESPQATHADLVALPSSFDDGRVETNIMGVTLLEEYTVASALRLSLPERQIGVHAASYETLRSGADTLRFTCAPLGPDGVEFTTSY
jgi:hypothetical protein